MERGPLHSRSPLIWSISGLALALSIFAVLSYRSTCPQLSRHLPQSTGEYSCNRVGVFPETEYEIRALAERADFFVYVASLKGGFPDAVWDVRDDGGDAYVRVRGNSSSSMLSAYWLDGKLHAWLRQM